MLQDGSFKGRLSILLLLFKKNYKRQEGHFKCYVLHVSYGTDILLAVL